MSSLASLLLLVWALGGTPDVQAQDRPGERAEPDTTVSDTTLISWPSTLDAQWTIDAQTYQQLLQQQQPLANGPVGEGPPMEVFGWDRIGRSDIVWTRYNVGVGTNSPLTALDIRGDLHLGRGAPVPWANLSVTGEPRAGLFLGTQGANPGTASRVVVANADTDAQLEVGLEKRSSDTSLGRFRYLKNGFWYDQWQIDTDLRLHVQPAKEADAPDDFGGVVFHSQADFQQPITLDEATVDGPLTANTFTAQPEAGQEVGFALQRAPGESEILGSFQDSTGATLWEIGVTGGAENMFQLLREGQGVLAFQREGDAFLMPDGNVGIGTKSPAEELTVDGTVLARKVTVDLDKFSDFVFDEDYQLRPLEEVRQYIDENGHLPDIPAGETVTAQGLDLGTMDVRLLQKIEELTLYTIDQHDQLERKRQAIQNLNEKVRRLQSQIQSQNRRIEEQREQIEQQQEQIEALMRLVEKQEETSKRIPEGDSGN